jgi:hypothetical protein
MHEPSGTSVIQNAEDQTQLVRAVVRIHGGCPEDFKAVHTTGGGICVMSPTAAAFYQPEEWLEKFTRHLDHGFFCAAKELTAPAVTRRW